MKKQILSALMLIATIFVAGSLSAQQPEKVYSIVKEVQSFEWYQAQAKAWKTVLDNDPKNGPGWIYYYTANRMARLTDRSRWEAGRGEYFKNLSDIVDMAGKTMPGTYESIYIKLYNNSIDYPDYEKDLLRAYELSRGRAEILDEIVLYYEVKRNGEKRSEFSKQWFRSNDIPAGILNYNYNVLQTLDDDAIILTGGDNDTYPLWVLQDALGLKPGVAVLNISLLTKEDYRKKIFGELQIPEIQFNAENYKDQDSLSALRKVILAQVFAKAKRPVYLALTTDTRYYLDADIQKDLYLTGLAMRYQKKEFDNLGVIRRHFENDYLLDYLKVNFAADPSAAVVAQMNTGYLPSLVKLCSHYGLSGESEKLAKVRQLIAAISGKAGYEKVMKEYNNCE
ncbi:MAG: hypothetical protein M0Q38_05800 [Bacteroidales bacterium]|jgi:hypothetical protein|nr:hypothetical protein [Bacteroidales bacterium]